MAEGGKGHRKKKSGRKADKRKAAETKKKSTDGGEGGNNDAARKQNPKAFIFKSRGKAKIQRARTAEKDQRRMHGELNKIKKQDLFLHFHLEKDSNTFLNDI
jgi:ribosome biogenesis protein BMS1